MKFFISIFFLLITILANGQYEIGMEGSIKDSVSLVKAQSEIPGCIQSGNTKKLADIYRAIGNYYYRQWYNDSIIYYFRNAIEQYKKINDSFHIAYSSLRIGESFSDGDSYAESLDWFLPATSYFERKQQYKLAAHSFYGLSNVYKNLNLPSKQEQFLQKAKTYAQLEKDTLLRIIILSAECDNWAVNENWDELEKGAQQVLQLSRLIQEPLFIKKGLLDIAEVKLHRNQLQEALRILNECNAVQGGGRHMVPETYRLLVITHLRLQNDEQAETYLALYKQASDSIQLVKENDNYREMLVKYDADKKGERISSLERENALKEKLAANQRRLILILSIGFIVFAVAVFLFVRNISKRRKLEKKLLQQEEKFKIELQQQEQQKLVAEFNKQLAEVQLTALNAQMNPHFIFNCMNSIQKYILKNERVKALEFLQNFSDLIRSVLDNSGKTKISLDEEINMLKKYVLLEQQRLDNKFEYSIEVDPDLQTDFFEIPGMIIQPYVENAIWHGLMNLGESQNGSVARHGMLKLNFNKEDAMVKCVVEDNGVGRKKAISLEKEKSPKRKSYGMTIAKTRIELLQKENEEVPEIKIEDLYTNGEPTGTKVTIYIHVD